MCWASPIWPAARGILQLSELCNDSIFLAGCPESREFLHSPQYLQNKLDVPYLFLDMVVSSVFCYGKFLFRFH